MSAFDRFADATEKLVSRSWFFAACVITVVLWAPSILLGIPLDTWQLIINTLTTIITFLLLALLTNTQRRFEERQSKKLDDLKDLIERMLDQ